MLLENLIPITLLVLFVSAIFATIFISKEASRIAKAYLDSLELKDADENKPTLIRISDDYGIEYIIKSMEIICITKSTSKNADNDNIYTIHINMSNEDCYTLRYDDIAIRDEIYDNFANYHINYE